MTLKEALDIIQKNVPTSKQEARNIFYSTTLHTQGVRPAFRDLSKNGGYIIEPPGYKGGEYQDIFEKYLLSRHPREEDVTRQWRYSQYRPLTKEHFQNLIDTVGGAIYQDNNFLISVEDSKDDEYIKGKNFTENNSFVTLFKNIFLQVMFEDPNGYLVTLPTVPSYEQTKDRLEVSVQYVRSVDILHESDAELIFKGINNKYRYWVTHNDIIRFVKVKEKWQQEDSRGYFAHKFGELPIIKLGGIYNTNGYYDSFIDKAIPIANEFISTYSAEQMIDKEASHPYIQQATVECPTCNGTGSVQEIVEPSPLYPNGTCKVECKTCQGKKQISINPSERYEVPIDAMDKDMVRIINPNISINQYHRDKNKDLRDDILKALNLLVVDEAQSGVAKAIDRENLYKFISKISNRLFELKEFCLQMILSYRSPKPKKDGYTIIKPSHFDLRTAKDLMTEIEEVINNNFPISIRKTLLNEFVDKRYKGNDFFIKKNLLFAKLDKTFGFTLDEISKALEIGLLTKTDVQKSVQVKDAIDQLIELKSESYFIEKSSQELVSEIKNIMN